MPIRNTIRPLRKNRTSICDANRPPTHNGPAAAQTIHSGSHPPPASQTACLFPVSPARRNSTGSHTTVPAAVCLRLFPLLPRTARTRKERKPLQSRAQPPPPLLRCYQPKTTHNRHTADSCASRLYLLTPYTGIFGTLPAASDNAFSKPASARQQSSYLPTALPQPACTPSRTSNRIERRTGLALRPPAALATEYLSATLRIMALQHRPN